MDPDSGEPDEEGYEDEYEVDPVDLKSTDYIKPITPPNFRAAWDGVGDENAMEEQFALSDFKSIKAGVDAVCRVVITSSVP